MVLLGGFLFWRKRQGGDRNKFSGETSFIESKIQPDSFFGASGGQRVDTRDGAANSASSSLNYSLSQLDAIGDVDPVAEADVYLAYGRDLQAEEILKEAQRSDPDRLAIRTKLLEVYAKRADLKTFETQARQLQGLTNGQGEDWVKAQELGRQIDPTNPLYTEGGEYAIVDTDPMPLNPLGDDAGRGDADASAGQGRRPRRLLVHRPADRLRPRRSCPPSSRASPAPRADRAHRADEHGLGRHRAPAARAPPRTTCRSRSAISTSSRATSKCRPSRRAARPPRPRRPHGARRRRRRRSTSTSATCRSTSTSPAHARRRRTTTSVLPDLDMGAAHGDSEPMARKIELADEFRRIGDHEGARELLEEVVSKADGPLKSRAQTMLDALG